MELPIAQAGHRPTADALVRAVRRAAAVLGRTVAEQAVLDAATCLTSARYPGAACANFAADLVESPEGGAERTMDEVTAHFESQGVVCLTLDNADGPWPADLADAASRRGYRPSKRTVYVLERLTPSTTCEVSLQIIPARAAYEELVELYRQVARADLGADDREATDMAAIGIDRLDEPRLDAFLGRVDQKPAATAGVLSLGQIGVIDAVRCDPTWRGRGIEAAMMHHVFEHCRRALFECIVLERPEGCETIGLYESLGFYKAGEYVRYERD